MALFSVVTLLLSPRALSITIGRRFLFRVYHAGIYPGNLLVSLILSSLFCYISLSPAIFMQQLGLSTMHYSCCFQLPCYFLLLAISSQNLSA
jgi:hypothetical protein